MRTIWQWLCAGRQLARVPRSAYAQNAIFGKFGIAAVTSMACLLSACALPSPLDYYWQSVWGEWQLLSGARPIPEVIADTKEEALKARLERIAEIREFASRELGLPENRSYMRYTDLGRPFVSWTVFATPELSLSPRDWCFPVAGCVSYRGYFRHADAISEAKRLESQGDDVYVGNVPAYSTLGYFDDPVLSSFVRWPETEVARLIFHELAHQLLYVPGDTVFNESYAVTVERAGLERWLAHEHRPELVAQFERTQRTRAEFNSLVQKTRSQLAEVYAGSAPASEKRRLKERAFAAMKAAYDAAKADDPGLIGYEGWFSHHPNNANLAAIALYTDRVPAFRAMLREEGNDLVRFYAHVKQLASLPKAERDRILDDYANRGGKAPAINAASRDERSQS